MGSRSLAALLVLCSVTEALGYVSFGRNDNHPLRGVGRSQELREQKALDIAKPPPHYSLRFLDWKSVFSRRDPEASLEKRSDVAGAEKAVEKPRDTSEGSASHRSLALLICVPFLFFGFLLVYIIRKYVDFWLYFDVNSEDNFTDYLTYNFENWFEEHDHAYPMVVFFVTVFVLILFATIYAAVEGTGLSVGLWRVFTWILDPGMAVAGGSFNRKPDRLILGAIVGVLGLVIFGLLLTFMQTEFEKRMATLKEGKSTVIENNHTMIIGFTEQTATLVDELCDAHESVGGTTIVLFSDSHTKQEMEEAIGLHVRDTRGTRLVVRCGKPYVQKELQKAAAANARMIILLPEQGDSKVLRDAFTLRVLVTLRGMGWPLHGRILLVCSVFGNFDLLQDIGGNVTDIVFMERFLSRIIVQCGSQAGLSTAIRQLFGFGGSEFYVLPLPDVLVGTRYGQLVNKLPEAVLLGVLTDKDGHRRSMFCPPNDFVFSESDEIVVIADDAAHAEQILDLEMVDQAVTPRRSSMQHRSSVYLASSRLGRQRSSSIVSVSEARPVAVLPSSETQERESSVIIGWNEMVGKVLLELDTKSPPNSQVFLLSPVDAKYREEQIQIAQVRWNQKLTNITEVHYLTGEIGSRRAVQRISIPFASISRFFFFKDEKAVSTARADGCTMLAAMHVREMMKDLNEESNLQMQIPMILEIQDPLSVQRCHDLQIGDFIDTLALQSQILSLFSFQPKVGVILREIMSGTVATFKIMSLRHYVPDDEHFPSHVSFNEVSAWVHEKGDVVIGWSRPFLKDSAGGTSRIFQRNAVEKAAFQETLSKTYSVIGRSDVEYDVNPSPKDKHRVWIDNEDMLVVLCVHGDGGASPDEPNDD